MRTLSATCLHTHPNSVKLLEDLHAKAIQIQLLATISTGDELSGANICLFGRARLA